ncbi:MAG: hypothetical protein JST24_07845 [Acidobacteria bacterium]|nr:hypothetical protein [Acidobacteriota bacterium]
MFQAWTVPPLNPPGEVRLMDNLQRKALRAPKNRHDGVPSAFVVVLGQSEDSERLHAFQDWLHKDLQLAFQAPPPLLGKVDLAILMANPADPMKAMLDQVRFTRSWYQAPLQVEAQERARVDALYK